VLSRSCRFQYAAMPRSSSRKAILRFRHTRASRF
jgi:hypothetical protein